MTKRRAMARPMPLAAPVTMTDFRLRSLAMRFPSVPIPVRGEPSPAARGRPCKSVRCRNAAAGITSRHGTCISAALPRGAAGRRWRPRMPHHRGRRAALARRVGRARRCRVWGTASREVTEAVKAQLDRLAFAHTGFFTSEPAEALADLLIEHAPAGLERVYLVSGGSEAVEAAIKLARQYFVETGRPERTKLIARRQSYHGNTLGALAVGGNEWRRAQFAPLLDRREPYRAVLRVSRAGGGRERRASTASGRRRSWRTRSCGSGRRA